MKVLFMYIQLLNIIYKKLTPTLFMRIHKQENPLYIRTSNPYIRIPFFYAYTISVAVYTHLLKNFKNFGF